MDSVAVDVDSVAVAVDDATVVDADPVVNAEKADAADSVRRIVLNNILI